MNEKLKAFLKSKTKPTPQGGYKFVLEGIEFNVDETPLRIGLVYSYISKRSAIEPIDIILDKNITLQGFLQKLVKIVKDVKSTI